MHRRDFLLSTASAAVGLALPIPVADVPRTLQLFCIDDGETHFVAAINGEDAIKAYAELCGWTPDEYREEVGGEIEVNACDPSEVIFVDYPDEPELARTQTAAEWAAEGRGLVATSCY